MAYFDKDDIQNSFVKAILDEFADVWGWENDNEYKSLVMEINGIRVLYEQIVSDMKAKDEEQKRKYEEFQKQKEAEKNNGGE